MTKPMMQCGHAANAQNESGEPVCVICFGIVPGADKIAVQPDLANRTAVCSYGPHGDTRDNVPSSTSLAFFEHQPDKPFDRYYCGCFGWD